MNDTDPRPELESRPQSRREWSGWLSSIVLPVGLVVVIVAGLFYLDSRGGSVEDDGFGIVELPAGRNATNEGPSAAEGRAAPDFVLQTIEGETLRLSDLQGSPVVVNFWATWCSSCRVETPDLIAVQERYESSGLRLVGVNLRESPGAIEGFVDDFGIPYPVVLDRRGEVASAWRIGGPVGGIPSTYFIDTAGVVRKVVFGQVTEQLAAEGLDLILPAGGG